MNEIETKQAFFVDGVPYATEDEADRAIESEAMKSNVENYITALHNAGHSRNVITRINTVMKGYSAFIVDRIIPPPKQKAEKKEKKSK